jgi:methionyl-tRNA synthetase
LANTLGNLVSRVTALVAQPYADGRVPDAGSIAGGAEERILAERQAAAFAEYRAAFAANRPHRALDAVFAVLAAGNEYITHAAPWAIAKDAARRPELDRALHTLVQLLARQAVLLAPVLPGKADEIWRALGGPGSVHWQRLAQLSAVDPAGWRATKTAPLFPRITKAAVGSASRVRV